MDLEAWRALLADGPLLTDGGTGTALLEAGAPGDVALETLNVERPDLVESVHRAFVDAGARVVLANTFGANRFRLERHGLADRAGELCAAGVTRARAAGATAVAGSLGPLGVRLQPYGRVPPEDASGAYAEQAGALAEAGVDLLVIETQTDLREMEVAVGAAREAAPGVSLLVSATFSRDDRTLLGSTPAEVAERLAAIGVDAIGVNCGEGPAQALRIVRAMARVTDIPIAARPNAGGPARRGGRFVYPATPDYVAEVALALVEAGASVVGGCCGVGPDHVRAIARGARAAGAAARGRGRASSSTLRRPPPPCRASTRRRSRARSPTADSRSPWRWSRRARSTPRRSWPPRSRSATPAPPRSTWPTPRWRRCG